MPHRQENHAETLLAQHRAKGAGRPARPAPGEAEPTAAGAPATSIPAGGVAPLLGAGRRCLPSQPQQRWPVVPPRIRRRR
jgi:hypothetical protein